jgi:hypothetical protein
MEGGMMLCFDDPKYWRDLAANERASANEDRARRGGTVESIRIHESNAAEYEARAKAIELTRSTDRRECP